MPLNPQAKKIINTRIAFREKLGDHFTPEMMRSGILKLFSDEVKGSPFNNLDIRDLAIPCRDGLLPARFYSKPDKFPENLIIFFHGGGFVTGSTSEYDVLYRAFAEETSCSLLAVEYHLAPEKPFPAAFNEAYEAAKWASKNISQFSAKRLIVAGDSAGGNLAAEVALRAKAENETFLHGQVLIYPCLDLTLSQPSMEMDEESCLASRRDLSWYYSQYCHGNDPTDWRLSPLWAKDLSGLPPTLIIAAEYDTLHDEGVQYANRLKNAGVNVSYREFEGMIHGFFQMRGLIPDADEAILWIGKEIEKWDQQR